MSGHSRREFLRSTGSLALAAASAPAFAAMGPNDKFDLVIKGGDVLDPSQNLRGKRDIGIRYGMIEAVEADIPAARAERVLSVDGKLVTPGLVDLHSHVFPYGSAIGIPADELVAHQCTTTCVSGGDAGANNFAAFPPPHRGADPHAALCLHPHRQHRADAVPGRRALQHRCRAG
jgi:dihydroorotase